MFLSSFAIRRPITTVMFFAAIVLLGIVSVFRLPLQLIPTITAPMGGAQVYTRKPMSVDEFERKIIMPIEGEIAQLPNVKNMRVYSGGGRFAFFFIEFEYGTSVKYRIVDLQDRLNTFRRQFEKNMLFVNAFPFETSKFNQWFLDLELKAPRGDPYVEGIDTERIQQKLENIDGVARCNLWGGRERTVDVQIMQDRLREFGVPMFNVINRVRTYANEPVFLGDIEEGSQKFYVRMNGQFTDTQEIADVNVKEDTNIALRHLGIVEETFRSRDWLRRHDGNPSLGMGLDKEAMVNVIELTHRTKKVIASINHDLPPGYEIAIENAQADNILDMLYTLSRLAVFGIVLSMIVLYLFIRNIRMTLIVCMVIPICIVATFNLMYFSDMSINMISLLGLAVGVGTLIDSSIVVLENIFRHHERGRNAMQSATIGSREVGMAVFALTITNVVVFLPIIFIEGEIKLIFTEGALAIIFPMVLSMLVALTFIPMATSNILYYVDKLFGIAKLRTLAQPLRFSAWASMRQTLSGWTRRLPLPNMHWCREKYSKLLKGCLRHRMRLLIGIVLLILYTYFYTMHQVGQDIMDTPEDRNGFDVHVYLPEGTKQDHTLKVVSKVEDLIIEHVPEKHHITSRVSDDYAYIWVRLKDGSERERESSEIKESLRPYFENFGDAEVSYNWTRTRGEDQTPPVDTGRGGMVEIRGPEYEQINKISSVFIEQMMLVPGVRDVESESEDGPLEVQFHIDRDAAAHLQITPISVAQSIQVAQRRGEFSSIEMKKGDNEIRIVFSQIANPEELLNRKPGEESADQGLAFDELMEVPVYAPALGTTVALKEIGRFDIRRGMGQTQRENRERIGRIRFSTSPQVNYSEVEEAIRILIDSFPAPAGYRITLGGTSVRLNENILALKQMAWLAILLVYMCVASLFESFTLPFVIALSIPLAIMGIIWALILTNTGFNEMAAMGIVFLIGMLPNSAILLIHFTGYLRRNHNYPRVRAMMKSGVTRLRPIFMTVLTTCLGLVPMAISWRGDEEWTPFAITVIGGLVSSTILTLIVVPGFYFIIEDVTGWFQRVMRYVTSWRWVLVFWSKSHRMAYKERLTAYRKQEPVVEPLQVKAEYLVRIYKKPAMERMLDRWDRLKSSMRILQPVPGFLPGDPYANVESTEARHKALDNIQLDIEAGIFGLLGPNGAGKTTLLRLLAGIDQPTRGFLSICGYDMKTHAGLARKKIGYLPQNFGVYSHMPAQMYLDYFALLKGIRRKAERREAVERALEMVNLSDQRLTPVKEFSGGMMRRIGLAQIFVQSPKVLIVDEPTVGLDPMERVRFRNLLVKLSRDRIVILSTHIVEDVAHCCQNIAIMDAGKILYTGPVLQLTESVRGKVWSVMVPDHNTWHEFRNRYKVVGQSHTGKGIDLRVVSDASPAPAAEAVAPTLEDAYIYHTHIG